ncbi:MAG: restriction endonuclease [Candidatus Viridilinea halotolerans]|uniref:Restriction endonuclease n=1 Tax=Candidatus Viridilinea halotolerans TaxID=2491704 RepID=A0A426TV15_9CHLR|nr:MAG: restriction endonuclease [Candidatus Viridilinea halotolerans]
MSVDTTPTEQKERNAEGTQHDERWAEQDQEQTEQVAAPVKPPLGQRVQASLRQVEWRMTLAIAALMAVTWCMLFLGGPMLQILAGIVPVVSGLMLGKRVKGEWLAHGLILGFSGFLIGLVVVTIYGLLITVGILPPLILQLAPDAEPSAAGLRDLLFYYGTFSLFALIPFPAFGTVMAGRAEQRNRELQREISERGGKLERPGVVRTLEDLQGLSLPQFGSFVLNLYRKKGFEFKDYHFIDKDKHLDLEMGYEGETYILRLSVADKVRPGTIESLVQELRRRTLAKGVVLTSTEFTSDAAKAGKDRRNVVLIDGQTLFEIAEV